MSNKRGRPPGSKNKPSVETVSLPPTCPKCGSADLTVVKGYEPIERELNGVLQPHGFQYSKVVWRMCECECGQRVKVRTYYP